MKAIRTSLIAASLALALGSTAFAQPGPMAGASMPQARSEHMREHMRENMGERHTKHLAELKTKLKLDAGQEGAWKTFADAMQPPATLPARPDRAAMEKMTTPERIDQMQALHSQHEAVMKKHAEATKAFYASLNAEQKKTFDAETGRFMARNGGYGMRGHHHF